MSWELKLPDISVDIEHNIIVDPFWHDFHPGSVRLICAVCEWIVSFPQSGSSRGGGVFDPSPAHR